jgi:hypothetical protein
VGNKTTILEVLYFTSHGVFYKLCISSLFAGNKVTEAASVGTKSSARRNADFRN